MEIIASAYRRTIPFRARHTLFTLRNLRHLQHRLKEDYVTEKARFSLNFVERYQCAFIHITKTAGTAVASSLFGELPEHLTAIQYRWIFGHDQFQRLFKFAIVRNPWDRLLSAFTYLKNGGWGPHDHQWAEENLKGVSDINEFVHTWLTTERLARHQHLWPQHWFVNDLWNRPTADFIGHFETLPQDFEYLKKKLQIEASLQFVNRSSHIDYRQAFDDAAVEKVASLYRRDIQQFKYSFDGLAQ